MLTPPVRVPKHTMDNRKATGKDEWLTPPDIVRALGPFDLDPCAAVNQPWRTAREQYTVRDDGLSMPWFGRVWLNPPYGRETARWLYTLASHGDGVALIFARTDTNMFFEYVWGRAQGVLFLRGRLHFHHVDGSQARANCGAPSCLVAYGDNNLMTLITCGLDGRLVDLRVRL